MSRESLSPAGDLARRLLGLLAIMVGAAVLLWSLAGAPYKGYQGESVEVVVPRGAPPAQVARLLREAGVIRSVLLFRLQAVMVDGSGRLQAGEYRFESPMSTGAVLKRILDGDVILHRVTFPEGLTGAEIIDRLASAGLAGLEELEEAFSDPSLLEDLDAEAWDLEGYLFPETYHFARPTPARQIFRAMVERFRQEFDEGLRSRGAEMGMTVREAVIMASLIEKETSLEEERGMISAVFHNRLRRGMPLQCDPTVIYALQMEGKYRGFLTRGDLKHDSPYNTYVNPGLPPGPIASPGSASLQAAVRPDDVSHLYFVADGSGGHTFSRTLDEHLRAVQRYRRLSREGT